MIKPIALALATLTLGGCATMDTGQTEPCTVPPLPELPEVTRQDLKPLPVEVQARVRLREQTLIGWALEMERVVERTCQ